NGRGSSFWKRANAQGAFSAFMVGFVLMLILLNFLTPITEALVANVPGAESFVYYNDSGEPVMHFLYVAPILAFICFIVLVVVSLATPPPPADKTEGLIWTKQIYREETAELAGLPWYQNFRYLSIILLIITGIIVYLYR
ncbi:MAG: sodium transporter, partial [Bacteroidota bacterium]